MVKLLKKLLRWCRAVRQHFLEPNRSYVVQTWKATLIGKSVKWKPIHAFTRWTWEKTLLINCWMHWNETGTIKFAQKLIKKIELWSIKIPPSVKISIIPCLNPDWYEEALKHPDYFWWGRRGKLNANGVNLVQNISTQQDFSSKATTYLAGKVVELDAGEFPFSEPEAQALRRALAYFKPTLFIDIHNAYPAIWGEQGELAEKMAKAARKKTGRSDRDQLYTTPDVKRYASQGIECFFIEGTHRYRSDAGVLIPVVEGVLRGLEEEFRFV